MRHRTAFTLIELVVVVLVVGILAAVAAPRMMDAADSAQEAALRQSLLVLRNAIEYHRAQNDAYPGDSGTEADLKADLEAFIKSFPVNPVKESASVAVQTTGAEITSALNGSIGWRYDNKSGQIVANSNGTGSDGIRYHLW